MLPFVAVMFAGSNAVAPPTGLSAVLTGGTRYVLHWTTGDAAAQTRIYQVIDGTPSVIDLLDPGVTSSDPGFWVGSGPWSCYAVHLKSGVESAATSTETFG